jgi:hypothetical protein
MVHAVKRGMRWDKEKARQIPHAGNTERIDTLCTRNLVVKTRPPVAGSCTSYARSAGIAARIGSRVSAQQWLLFTLTFRSAWLLPISPIDHPLKPR